MSTPSPVSDRNSEGVGPLGAARAWSRLVPVVPVVLVPARHGRRVAQKRSVTVTVPSLWVQLSLCVWTPRVPVSPTPVLFPDPEGGGCWEGGGGSP